MANEIGQPLRQGACIVFSGRPGVGKSTIARDLHEMLSRGNGVYGCNSSLISHHHCIDYVQCLVSRTSDAERHMDTRWDLLRCAIRSLKDDPDVGRKFLITAPAMLGITRPRRRQEMQLYIDLARYRAIPFIWFRLICRPAENKRRVEDVRRGPTKVRNYEALEDAIGRETDRLVEKVEDLLDVVDVKWFSCVLDVSDKTSEESARAVLDIIEGLDLSMI